MNSLRLLQLFLVIHLTGLTLMAGTTAVSFAAFKGLSNSLNENKDVLNYYLRKISGLSGILLLGGILLVLSGVGLLVITHAYGQLWFHIKMGVVAALPLNGFLFGSRQERKLKKIIQAPDGQDYSQLRQPVASLRNFYALQLVLFLAVVVLAVVKPG